MTCVVFTDTERLAEKYNVSRAQVTELLEHNLVSTEEQDFLLLDACDYKEELSATPGWEGYKAIILDFFMGMGVEKQPTTSVFIIGGDDVVPMPRIESPINPGEMLHADFAYCFESDDPIAFDVNEAMCNVGRLPMENGKMPRPIKDDLQSYFNLVSMFLEDGIEVGSVVMTSTQSWLPASSEMVRDLPTSRPKPIEGATLENMYVSPLLDRESSDSRIQRQYKKDIGSADMLMFNLHGADAPNYSSFYGEGANGHNTPEAFSIEMIKDSGARIFNTVACFGARFIGYNRNQSMLLNAIYGGGVLLYAGSCVSALGRSGYIHQQAHDILIPAGMSESLMKLYSHYLIQGMPAGLAMLKAKCDYFNTCRSLDGDEYALATILMFNLYGLPVLKVAGQNKVDKISNAGKPLPVSRSYAAVSQVYEKNPMGGSILAQIRSRVDANLQKIKETVASQLYAKWGLNPTTLERVDRLLASDGSSSYRFEYLEHGPIISKKIWALVDNAGKVSDVIHLK